VAALSGPVRFPILEDRPAVAGDQVASLRFGRGVLDGTAANTATAVRLGKGKPQKQGLKTQIKKGGLALAPWWGCGCYAVAGMAELRGCWENWGAVGRLGGLLGEWRAAMADVAVTLDATVSGLKERMHIAPGLAACLMSDPGAWVTFWLIWPPLLLPTPMHIMSLSPPVA
jgi:hypothetical protein